VTGSVAVRNTDGRFSSRGWLLFGIMAVLWGMPYLFIKEAVETITPAGVVAGRTLAAALLLLPFALRARALRPAFARIGWVLAFGAIEMAGPFLLLGHAEQTLSSGLTGLLVATVPLFGAIIAVIGGDRAILRPSRIAGLLIGFAGVGVIVAGPAIAAGDVSASLIAVGEVLLVAVLYATAPFIVTHKLKGVPPLGTITISLLAVGLFYLPIALLVQPAPPSARSLGALAALAVLCTALAFIAFFALIAEVGPARAPLFTYVNPVVAILLGVVILGESLTVGLVIGFPLVIAGCWLAATGGTLRPPRSGSSEADRAETADLPPVAPG
jgi:drug/metabolite transporter (DMT)-like permease